MKTLSDLIDEILYELRDFEDIHANDYYLEYYPVEKTKDFIKQKLRYVAEEAIKSIGIISPNFDKCAKQFLGKSRDGQKNNTRRT